MTQCWYVDSQLPRSVKKRGAGRNAGLAGGLHVLSGHGTDAVERAKALAFSDTTFQVLTGDEVGAVLKALPLFPKI